MKTTILRVDPNTPQVKDLQTAAEIILNGGIAAIPTDTVYGLVANPKDARAVQHIYEIKGRDFRLPLILLADGLDMIKRVFPRIPEAATKAMEYFWPGALTIVLKSNPQVPKSILADGESVGLRVPAHTVTQGLIQAVSFPLASTSANRSGETSAISAAEVMETFRGKIELIIDAGPAPLAQESSIVDFTATPPRLLREGGLSRSKLEGIIGPLN